MIFFIFAMWRHFWSDAVSFIRNESEYLPARIDQTWELMRKKFWRFIKDTNILKIRMILIFYIRIISTIRILVSWIFTMDKIINEFKKHWLAVIEDYKSDIFGLRAGRINPAMVEDIQAESYGVKMPLKQLATITSD